MHVSRIYRDFVILMIKVLWLAIVGMAYLQSRDRRPGEEDPRLPVVTTEVNSEPEYSKQLSAMNKENTRTFTHIGNCRRMCAFCKTRMERRLGMLCRRHCERGSGKAYEVCDHVWGLYHTRGTNSNNEVKLKNNSNKNRERDRDKEKQTTITTNDSKNIYTITNRPNNNRNRWRQRYRYRNRGRNGLKYRNRARNRHGGSRNSSNGGSQNNNGRRENNGRSRHKW